jgi:AcrR family transcriptional regulator
MTNSINRLINFVADKAMEKEKIDKKDHILDVAERIFSDLGFDGASTRMISGEANVNMAMLNYYFGSKEGLFLAIFERKISSLQELLENIGNDETMTPWNKLEKFLDTYVDRVVVNSCFQKLINREMQISKRLDVTEKLTEIVMLNVNELQKLINEGIKSGDFYKDADTALLTATIFGTKNYIINMPSISSAMFGHDIRDEKYLEEHLKPRVRIYMKRLLKAYLMHDNDHTK